jgi:hypothetical protein
MQMFDMVHHDDTLIIHRILSAMNAFHIREGPCGAISKPDAIGLIANAASATQHHAECDSRCR